jgi:hypothetical protein
VSGYEAGQPRRAVLGVKGNRHDTRAEINESSHEGAVAYGHIKGTGLGVRTGREAVTGMRYKAEYSGNSYEGAAVQGQIKGAQGHEVRTGRGAYLYRGRNRVLGTREGWAAVS